MTRPFLTRRTLLGAAAATGGLLSAAPPARAQAAPLRLGVLADLSGPYRDTAGPTSIACVRQAVADFQAIHPDVAVEVFTADHLQKADVALSVARSWFDRDGVDVVMELNNSSVALAVNQIVSDRNKVQLNTGALSSDLTGKACTPNFIHWAADSWMCAHAIGTAMAQRGSRKWFFIAPDYALGHSLRRDTGEFVEASGGTIVGTVFYPFPSTSDFSAYLLQAQSSGADTIGLCNGSGDLQNTFKQAAEFGMGGANKVRMAPLVVFATDVHAVGLPIMQRTLVAETFYWDLNDATREFARQVLARAPGNYPQQEHAASYAAAFHYLKTAAAMGAGRAKASGADTVAAMKRTPTDDRLFGQGRIREDGRWLVPVHLFEVKTPAESSGPWDVYRRTGAIPGDQAFRPLANGGCPMVKA